MRTAKLIAVEIPNQRFVVRFVDGARLGTIFQTGLGWCYQFDGTAEESQAWPDSEQALRQMELVASRLGDFADPRPLLQPANRTITMAGGTAPTA